MRRAGIGFLLVGCALAGACLAVALAAPRPAAGLATGTTGTTGTTVATGTTGTTGTTTTGTTTTTTTTVPTTPRPPSVIASDVTIGGVAVGGLTADAAYAIVRAAFDAPLVLTYRGRSLTPTPKQFGAVAYVETAVNRARRVRPGAEVRLVVRVQGERVRAYVRKLARRFDRAPVDARLVLRGLRPFLTRERPGAALDRTALTKSIVDALAKNARFPIGLPITPVRPEVTRKGFGAVVVIRRASNRLYLYEGARFVRVFGVATGQSRYPTPLGRFSVVVKWRNPWWYPPNSDWARGQKPIPPGPGNPLGTRWMGLSAPGVGIHGTPDAASIGYSLSHGCIRMRIPDAEWLFTRVSVGTTVFIVSA